MAGRFFRWMLTALKPGHGWSFCHDYGTCQAVTQKSWPGTQTVLFTEALLLRKRDSDGLAHDKNR